jgi:error-prone DNA polymerase
MLNNQPMGFYSPATLVKDAQRHGLIVKPIDVTRSDWSCAIEDGAMRVGLRYIRGMREASAHALARERARAPFVSVDDLARRVPELQKREMVMLAEAGALNFLDPARPAHRRDALWQVERACRRSGPLLETSEMTLREVPDASPLRPMTPEERVVADFHTSGLTTGPHPMAYCRNELNARRVLRAIELPQTTNGVYVRVAGAVIARQRPGAAKGFVFLSLEDETGISNVIIAPDVFQKFRMTVVGEPFLLVEGRLQHLDGAISVKASRVEALAVSQATVASHDFH